MIGAKLGPYEITAKLGEGGMGEVYRATDSKLRREVAIKVLPAAFTADPERLARFEREAQLLAQLQHPNIAAIYGLEESGGVRALVMELVDGPTLAERLESGPLGLEDTLTIARQIAEALEEAHEKGIVHRDLKPANIKLAPGAKVKVLDFGLAKAMASGSSAGDAMRSPTLMNSPTLTGAHGTQLGVILGTAAYMAPEQAAGGAADRRADVWAFGVVLYEMLSGRRLFEGETVSHVLAGVLKDAPDFAALPSSTPRRIEDLVRRCLRKKPRERLQAIGDARVVIDEVLTGAVDEAAPSLAAVVERRSRPAWQIALALAAVAGAGALLALAISAVVGSRNPATSAPRTLAEISLPEGIARVASAPALSPDGTKLAVAYEGTEGSFRNIWIRNLATGDERQVPGTETGRAPFWSPDSRSLGYQSAKDAQIKRVDLDGGRPVAIASAPSNCGASWGHDFIVFCEALGEPLKRVSPSGGAVEPVTTLAEARRHVLPSFLPDGKRFLFLEMPSGTEVEDRLVVGSVDGGEPRVLLATSARASYDNGYLFYTRGQTLFARPFDLSSGTLGEGEPRIVVEETDSSIGGRFAVAAGLLVYAPPGPATGARIAIYDRAGKQVDRIDSDTFLDDLVLSPDGRFAAVMKATGGSGGGERKVDVWTIDLARKVLSRVTNGEADDDPVFSPDGQSIAYAHAGDLYRRPANGPGEPKRLVDSRNDVVAHDWTGDGWIVYSDFENGAEDLFAVLAEGGEPKRLTSTPFREGLAQLSPDGRWLAYVSDESGDLQVYLTTWPDVAGKWRASTASATMPRWGRGGRDLYFLSVDSKVTRAPIATAGAAPEIGMAEELFGVQPSGAFGTRTTRWEAAADGERFYVLEAIPDQGPAGPALMLMTNPLAGGGQAH